MILSDRTGWIELAECRGMDPNLFHPGRGDNRGVVEALQVCERCPVTAQCLLDKMTVSNVALPDVPEVPHDRHIGIVGGTTGRQRRQMDLDPSAMPMLRLRAQVEAQGLAVPS